MSPFELLLFGLLVAGVILFNYLTQQAAKKARQREARRTPARGRTAGESAPPATEAMEQYEWGRPREVLESHSAPPIERTRAAPAPTLEELQALALARASAEAERPPSPPPQRRAQAARLFHSRDDLRRAVIAMTVLGPCRAIEPADLLDRSTPMPRAR